MKPSTKAKLDEAASHCDPEASIPFMIQYMQEFAGVSHNCVINYLRSCKPRPENCMSASDILKDWLVTHGFDGLCSKDCSCGLDTFTPCSPHSQCEGGSECFPAHKVFCADCFFIGNGDFCYRRNKLRR